MTALDNFEAEEKDVMCPECKKHQKHVKLVETKGRDLECPECHYLHLIRR